MTAKRVFICAASRTPVAAIGGGLSEILARPLASMTIKATLDKFKIDPNLIEYTYMGWGLQDPRTTNPAKSAAEFAGVPHTAPGTTLQENCASGGAAIQALARNLRTGDISVGLAGGVEAASNVPRLLYVGRMKGQQYGDVPLHDGLFGGLTDVHVGPKGELMGLLTERLVTKYKVTRQQQDEVAYRSHHNACDAWEKGFFDYVNTVEVPSKKGVKKVDKDECPRRITMDELKAAKPYFKPKDGTITGLNASSLNDASAFVVMANEDGVKKGGLTPLAELKAYGNVGVQREYMGEGAFIVLPKLLKDAGLKFDDVDYYEMNEAFAAVVAGALNHFKDLKVEKINQWGSGISIGHPIAATGARQVVDMVHQLRKRGKRIGITSRCVGGGIGSGEVIQLV